MADDRYGRDNDRYRGSSGRNWDDRDHERQEDRNFMGSDGRDTDYFRESYGGDRRDDRGGSMGRMWSDDDRGWRGRAEDQRTGWSRGHQDRDWEHESRGRQWAGRHEGGRDQWSAGRDQWSSRDAGFGYGQGDLGRGRHGAGQGDYGRFREQDSAHRYSGDYGRQQDWGRGGSQAGRSGQMHQHDHDHDYHSWRESQLSAFDRDYDEFRRHRQERFNSEFDEWRRNRQNQGGQMNAGGTSAATQQPLGGASESSLGGAAGKTPDKK